MVVRQGARAGGNPSKPSFLPTICSVSKTFEETVARFLENSEFRISLVGDQRFLTAFLAYSPGRFELMRKLHLDCFFNFLGASTRESSLELANLCTGLRTITLGFGMYGLCDVVDVTETTYRIKPHSAAHLFPKCEFQHLLGCDMLRSIIIIWVTYRIDSFKTAGLAAKALGRKLEQEFAAKKPKQVVTVTCKQGW